MVWFTRWVESIVARVVDARMAAVEKNVMTAVTSAQPEIDYDRLVQAVADSEQVYSRIASHIDLNDLAEEINTDSIESNVLEKIDMDDVARTAADNVETADIAQHVSDNFEFDYSEFDIDYSSLAHEVELSDLASEVKDQIELDMSELAEDIDYEELAKALIKLAAKNTEVASNG